MWWTPEPAAGTHNVPGMVRMISSLGVFMEYTKLVGARSGEAYGVPGDGGGLDDGRIPHVEALRHRHEPLGRRPELLRHAAVGHHAQGPLGVCGAQVVLAL